MADTVDVTSEATGAKARVSELVESMAAELVSISRQIHAEPELGFEEHTAHRLLTDAIESAGVSVERGAFEIDTAFMGRAGSDGPTIAVCCEYDALPGIGHACGHNIIAAAGLGAGLAAAAVAEELGGRVVIMGTPAEEGGGGKVMMIERGAFEGVDAAMMIHPAAHDLLSMSTIAIHPLNVTYHGQAAHAAAAPHEGRNALDAAVLGYMGVAALRQHILPGERIHGVFTNGGAKPNVVPDVAAMEWYVRSPTVAGLQLLKERVLTALAAGASAAGCAMTHEWGPVPYSDMIDNDPFLDLYAANAAGLGRPLERPDATSAVVGSTDMGNVSYVVPSIHPMIKVADDGSPIHTPKFAEHAGSENGDRAVIDGAKAMAMTVVDLWTNPAALEEVVSAHDRS